MLWQQTSGQPQRLTPRGGRSCPDFGTHAYRAIDEQKLNPGRWRT